MAARGWNEFRARIEAARRAYVPRVWQTCAFIALKAADDAPKGWSLQLSRSGINALPPVMDGPRIVGIITASAISASGFDYGEYQHDEELQHVSRQPNKMSFTDLGESGTQKERYRQGYESRPKWPKYVSGYLSRQFVIHEARIRRMLKG